MLVSSLYPMIGTNAIAAMNKLLGMIEEGGKSTMISPNMLEYGNLIWKPQIADIDSIKLDFIGSITHADSTATLNSDNNYSYHGTYVSIEPNQEGFLDCVINFRGGHTGVVGCKTRNFQIKVPISGVYSIIPLSKFEGYQEDEYHGNQELLHSDWSESEYNCFNGYLVDSASIPIITSNKDKRNVVGRFYLPIFNIEPQNVYNFNSSNTSDTYNRGTRAASGFGGRNRDHIPIGGAITSAIAGERHPSVRLATGER